MSRASLPQNADFTSATFIKSQRSASNGACVEVATSKGLIGIRDSKDPSGPVLVFTRAEWQAFVGGVEDGDFVGI